MTNLCKDLPCGNYQCPATLQCLWQGNGNTIGVIPLVIDATIIFVGIVSLAMVIYAGFRYITSQADKKTIDTANKTIFFAAVGLFIVMLSFFFLNIIGAATGVTCIEPQNVLSHGFQACQ